MCFTTRASRHISAALTRLLGTSVAALLATSVLTTSPAAADTAVSATSGTFVVSGAGWGHGWGMSQYGAYGAATKGLSWKQILAFYYPGTKLTQQPSGYPLRVWITADNDGDLRVRPAAGLTLRDASGHSYLLPTGTQYRAWRIKRSGTGYSLSYRNPDGVWVTQRTTLSTTTWRFTDTAKIVKVVMPGGSVREYRGSVSLIKWGTSARTVNRLAMESYLRSVVPSEMPTSWAANAVRSQAVAARSYATKLKSWASSRSYDICDTTACQVYRGYAGTYRGSRTVYETTGGNASVAATDRVIVTYNGTAALTQFSSSNGGHSAQGDYPYLAPRPDPYDGLIKSQAWSRSISASSIAQRWPSVGTVRQLQITARDGEGRWGGRVKAMKIIGSTGTVPISGTSFQRAFGLRSTLFTIGGATVAAMSATAQTTVAVASDSAQRTVGAVSANVQTSAPPSSSSAPGANLLLINPDGSLRRYSVSNATLGTAVTIGTGYRAYSHVVKAGDWNRDGYQDIIVRTEQGGHHLLMRGTMSGGLAAGVDMGFAASIRTMTGVGDANGDQFPDLAVISRAGNLWLLYGDGRTGLKSVRMVSGGWKDHMWLRGVGDWNRDGKPDLVSRTDDTLFLHPGTAAGFGRGSALGAGWSSIASITSVGDFDGDGRGDILARGKTGSLLLYRGNGTGGLEMPQVLAGSFAGARFVV
jgi:stage II sporulation protein D